MESLLSKTFDGKVPTPDFHREVWKLCCDRHPYVAIAAPRGFAKSTAVTHCFTLASVLFRDRDFVVLVSDTETQAVMFLQDIKKELQENEELQNLFQLKKDVEGKVRFNKETESDIIVSFTDDVKFRIVAKGSEQKVRGLKWRNKRPNLIICDDLENDEIVLNKERREKFKRWFFGALRPILSDNGRIRVVGTILHMDSLLEGLMPESQLQHLKKRKWLRRYALKEISGIKLPWLAVKYRAHDDNFDNLLWPDKMPREILEEKRQDYIAQGLPEVYSQEYLNVPIDESFAIFRRGDFIPIRDEDYQKNVNYYAACDIAVSEKTKADYSAIVIAAMDSDGMLQVRKVIRERADAKTLVDILINVQRQYKVSLFGMEEGAVSKSIYPFLRAEMLRTGVYLNIFWHKPSADKVTRSRSIQARMRAGGVRFNREADWFSDLEQECLRFPRDRHDDQVDALSYVGLMVDRLQSAATPEELAEEEYEREVERSGNDFSGKNTYTGY